MPGADFTESKSCALSWRANVASPERSSCAEVVAWQLDDLPDDYRQQREHLVHVQQLSDAHTLHLGDEDILVTYLLKIRHASVARVDAELPWNGEA